MAQTDLTSLGSFTCLISVLSVAVLSDFLWLVHNKFFFQYKVLGHVFLKLQLRPWIMLLTESHDSTSSPTMTV